MLPFQDQSVGPFIIPWTLGLLPPQGPRHPPWVGGGGCGGGGAVGRMKEEEERRAYSTTPAPGLAPPPGSGPTPAPRPAGRRSPEPLRKLDSESQRAPRRACGPRHRPAPWPAGTCSPALADAQARSERRDSVSQRALRWATTPRSALAVAAAAAAAGLSSAVAARAAALRVGGPGVRGERRQRVGACAGTAERAGGGRDGAPRRWARCRASPRLGQLGRGPNGAGSGAGEEGTGGGVRCGEAGLKAAPGRALSWEGPQGCPGWAMAKLQWVFPPESLSPPPPQFVPRWSEEGAAARPGGARVR